MKEKDLSCLGLFFTACLVLGRLLASSRMFQKHTFSVGDIHLGLPPSRSSSVSAPLVSRHPSRSSVSGTSSNQVNQIYVIIFSQPVQLTSKDLLFKIIYSQNYYKTGINSQLCRQNGYNSIIQSISHQNTCSFSQVILHTHQYTPSHTHTTAGINKTHTSLDPYTTQS